MDGLRFECQSGCTKCCDVEGRVYITADTVEAAARYLGIPLDEFEKTYVVRSKHLLWFRKPRGRQCHFLRDGGCQIHPVKPVQCRLFPFWPEIIGTRREWNRTAKWCPGMNQGPLISIEKAKAVADEMNHAYPSMYVKPPV